MKICLGHLISSVTLIASIFKERGSCHDDVM